MNGDNIGGPYYSVTFEDHGMAVFVRRCPKCNRFVPEPDFDSVACTENWQGDCSFKGLTVECSRCGPVEISFEGWF